MFVIFIPLKSDKVSLSFFKRTKQNFKKSGVYTPGRGSSRLLDTGTLVREVDKTAQTKKANPKISESLLKIIFENIKFRVISTLIPLELLKCH